MTTKTVNNIHERPNKEFLGWGYECHYKSVLSNVFHFPLQMFYWTRQMPFNNLCMRVCFLCIIWTLNCPDYHTEIYIYLVIQIWKKRGLKKMKHSLFPSYNRSDFYTLITRNHLILASLPFRQYLNLNRLMVWKSQQTVCTVFLHKAPLSPYWQVKCCQVNCWIQIWLW